MAKETLAAFVKKIKRPKVNLVKMIIDAYMEAGQLVSDDVGKKIGLTGPGFRSMMARPMGNWRLEEIEIVCRAVDCPAEEIYEALMKRSHEECTTK